LSPLPSAPRRGGGPAAIQGCLIRCLAQPEDCAVPRPPLPQGLGAGGPRGRGGGGGGSVCWSPWCGYRPQAKGPVVGAGQLDVSGGGRRAGCLGREVGLSAPCAGCWVAEGHCTLRRCALPTAPAHPGRWEFEGHEGALPPLMPGAPNLSTGFWQRMSVAMSSNVVHLPAMPAR